MGKAERRQDLLRAARDVFATKGYHDAKVDDIVALARVAKGTFYLYFPDKRSVFSELVDLLFQRLGAAILRVDTQGDVEAQVKHNIRAIVAVLLDDPALTRILLSYAAGLDAGFLTKIRSFYDGVRMLLEHSLIEGQRLGIVGPGEPRLLSTFTIGALKEILLENVGADAARPREEIVEQLFAFLSTGFLRIEAAKAAPPKAPSRPSRRRKAN
ncbi:MAG: TetR/AcrR family transcriptional regulator [Minicystis sp.]